MSEKLCKYDGYNYTGWVEKMKFLLMTLNVYYVLDPNLSPIPEVDPVGENDNETVIADVEKQRQVRKEDEALCYKYIKDSLSDRLCDLYALPNNNNDPRLLWKALEDDFKAKLDVENKSLVRNFLDFRMVDGKPITEQVREFNAHLQRLADNFITIHEIFYIVFLITKLPPSWKDFAERLMIDNLSLADLFKEIRIEERAKKKKEEKARKKKEKKVRTAPRRMKNTKSPSIKRQLLGVKKTDNNFKKTASHCNVGTNAINTAVDAQLADLMAHTNLIKPGTNN